MKSLFISLSLAIGFIACAPRVTVDTAQGVDFSRFQTYSWMQSDVKAGQNPLYYNQIASQQVESTIQQALTQRGLREVSRRPDLLVGYHFFVEEKTRTIANNRGPIGMYGPYYGWGRWGYRGWGPSWWGWNSWGPMYTQEKYEAGTVVVDMVDARTKQLIWRGSVQNAISDPARIKNQLAREIQRIVEKLPQRTT
ncbi:DUF4136 domain-containing protein [Spirosoma jeollabukense]